MIETQLITLNQFRNVDLTPFQKAKKAMEEFCQDILLYVTLQRITNAREDINNPYKIRVKGTVKDKNYRNLHSKLRKLGFIVLVFKEHCDIYINQCLMDSIESENDNIQTALELLKVTKICAEN